MGVEIKNTWKGMDSDDIPGYLIDYVQSWIKERDITSIDRFYEKFQSDSFQEELEDFSENIIIAVLEMDKND